MDELIIKLSCEELINEVSSSSPAPGGGSVSALAGALAAALVGMVARLTSGKDQPEAEDMKPLLEKALALQRELQEYVDRDTEAFNQVTAAFRMPRESKDEKRIRSEAVQAAMKDASLLPLHVAQLCLDTIKITGIMISKGNPNALSDAGVALLMAYSGVRGAGFNVQINLHSIHNKEFVKEISSRLEHIVGEAQIFFEQALKEVSFRLS